LKKRRKGKDKKKKKENPRNETSTSATVANPEPMANVGPDEYENRHFSRESWKGNLDGEALTLHYANIYRWRCLSRG
jgi:hypothetical protein